MSGWVIWAVAIWFIIGVMSGRGCSWHGRRLHQARTASRGRNLGRTRAASIGSPRAISDELLEHFAVVAAWDDLADALIRRYQGVASRIVSYLASEDIQRNPEHLERWGEVARAVAAV